LEAKAGMMVGVKPATCGAECCPTLSSSDCLPRFLITLPKQDSITTWSGDAFEKLENIGCGDSWPKVILVATGEGATFGFVFPTQRTDGAANSTALAPATECGFAQLSVVSGTRIQIPFPLSFFDNLRLTICINGIWICDTIK